MTIPKVLSFLALASCVAAQTPTQVDFGTQVKNKNSYPVTQNTAGTNGGYMVFSPVTYNPYDGGTCLDMWGNPVQQPVPGAGQPAFGTNDLVLWNSLSPSMPFAPGTGTTGLVQNQVFTSNPVTTGPGPCGVPLPVNGDYGINTNGYFFGRAGIGTDNSKYNSIQSLQGGVTANSFTAGVLYPAGTQTTTGVLSVPAYLGGHVDTGHSVGPPTGTTIQTSTNPFSGGEGLVAGMIYYDDALHCESVYSGTTWGCIGAASGGSGSGGIPQNAIAFGTGVGSALTATTNFTFNPSIGLMVLARLGPDSGFVSPHFNVDLSALSGTVTVDPNRNVTWVSGLQFYPAMAGGNITINNIYYLVGSVTDSTHLVLSTNTNNPGPIPSPVPYSFGNAFQTSTGSIQLTTGGTGLFQSVVANTVFNSRADVTGGNAFQTQSGNTHITGAGDAFFQSVAMTNGWTSGGGASLTSGGVLTVTACTGCGAGGGGGGGGGGGAGGITNSVQYNNGSNVSTGDANLLWNPATHVLVVLGGANQGYTGPSYGANAGTLSSTNTEFSGTNFTVRGDGRVGLNGALQFGTSLSADPAQVTGTGPGNPAGAAIYYNNAVGEFRVSYATWFGGAWTGFRSPSMVCTAALGNVDCMAQKDQQWHITGDGTGYFHSINLGTGGPTFGGLGQYPLSIDTSGNLFSTGTITGKSTLTMGTAGQFAVAANGDFATSGHIRGLSDLNIGTYTQGVIALSGGGASIANITPGGLSMDLYDSGGFCHIGTVISGIACTSDARLKTNITALPPALSAIMALRSVNFNWKANGLPGTGFIAQEVQKILPNLISEKDGYLVLAMNGMIPYLVKAIQEQQKEIDALRATIPSSLLASFTSGNATAGTQSTTRVSN